MPIQSYLMMYFAGGGWQIGKRKISAIPNDKFNKMSVKELLEDFTGDLRDTMPTLERTLNDVTPLIKVLVEQYGDFVREAIKAIPGAIGNIFQQSATEQSFISNVRLSQGSQQFQRDRELYAGGAPSQFQLDIQRQRERTMNQRLAESEKRRLEQEAIRKRNDRAEAILKLVPINSQIAKTNLTGKKKAGQSQKMEKIRLQKAISVAWRNPPVEWIKTAFPKGAKGRQGVYYKNMSNPAFAAHVAVRRKLQQQLVNLLARYRF